MQASGGRYMQASGGRYNGRTHERPGCRTGWDCGSHTAGGQGDSVTRDHRLSLLKMLPGLLISAFFIWWTYIRVGANGKRGFDPAVFHDLHLVARLWIAGVVGFGVAGYGLRCVRAWAMLRSVKARFGVCARVFMTSLAANNILPLRIGDVMRRLRWC
jgi:hypothetical protein